MFARALLHSAHPFDGMGESVFSILPGAVPELLPREVFVRFAVDALPLAPEMAPAQLLVALPAQDWTVSIAATSNDPTYTSGGLWGMYGDTTARANAFGSQAGEAWADGSIGGTKAVVGVIDTGIDYTHSDLFLNVWLNQHEIPAALRLSLTDIDTDGLITFRDLNATANARHVSDLNGNGRIDAGDLLRDTRWENGIDEDGNGYRDDLVGWDFANNDNDPFDDQGHGTHVAGTIGALGGNGTGVAGVAWKVQMVALKFLGADGSGSTSNAVRAVDYFTSASAKASASEDFVGTNNSWGGGGYSSALDAAIQRAAAEDLLFIAAAGNSARNTDVSANWPSNYKTGGEGQDVVVSVAALTSTGGLASFSNYGALTVDLAAPGQGIASTLPGERYGTYSGTSMAAPHVTGAAVLYAIENPDASAAEIKTALLATATATSSLAGRTVTGGRLDIGALLDHGRNDETPPPVVDETASITRAYDDAGSKRGWLQNGARTDDASPQITGRISDALEKGESLVVYRDGVRVGEASWSTSRSGTTWSFTDTSQPADGTHAWTVRVENTQGGVGAFSAAFSLTIDTSPNRITGTTRNDTLRGTADADILSGVPAGDTSLGAGTVDRLTGGAGNDIFVLGDARGVFYDDKLASSSGFRDYGVIVDFKTGDRIQLSDDMDAYWLSQVRIGSLRGTGIFADTDGDFRFDAQDELIGIVQNVTRLSQADFIFV